MKTFLFCSRHTITPEQAGIAVKAGIKLIQGTDLDGFETIENLITGIERSIPENLITGIDGVVVVHPSLALKLSMFYQVGVFENANRAPEGEKPSFMAIGLEIFDMIPRVSSWEHVANYDYRRVIA